MDRDEQIGIKLPGNLGAMPERQNAVIRARQRHPDPARPQQFVTQRQRQRERDVLLLHLAPLRIRASRARIAPAMAGIDHYQRKRGITGTGDGWQINRCRLAAERKAQHIIAAQRRHRNTPSQRCRTAKQQRGNQQHNQQQGAKAHVLLCLRSCPPITQ